MAAETDNLILEMLRRIDMKLDRLIEDVQDLRVRMIAVEKALARLVSQTDQVGLAH